MYQYHHKIIDNTTVICVWSYCQISLFHVGGVFCDNEHCIPSHELTSRAAACVVLFASAARCFLPSFSHTHTYLRLPKDIGPPTLLEIFRRAVGLRSTQPWRHAHTHTNTHPPTPTLFLSHASRAASTKYHVGSRRSSVLCCRDLSRRYRGHEFFCVERRRHKRYAEHK
jgi:hypothetical protein